jgi:hypothetical protein
MTVVADAAPPEVAFAQSPDGTNGWFRTAPASVRVTATDDSAVASLACTLDGEPAALEGDTLSVTADGDHLVACTATDDAGNAGTAETHVKLDATAPTVAVGGVADGQIVLLGAPRPVATCSSGDAGSGVASTSGPTEQADLTANGVGTVSVTCTATDAAGNTATATRSYGIGYAFGGFLRPVQGLPAVNAGRAGRAYPVKWQLRDASGGFVDVLSAVSSIRYRAVACDTFGGDATEVDATTSGDSGLRYDAGTDAYVYTWKMPATSGCYVLSLALDSGQAFEADFRLS